MRIELVADSDRLVLVDARLGDRGDAWIEQDGVEGLWGTPKPRESGVAIPQMDGSYWPSRLTSESRTVTIRCVACAPSDMALARLVDRVNALACQRVTLVVNDAAGRRTLTGWIADDPGQSLLVDMRTMKFSLIVYCPDPLKYGPEVSSVAELGLATIENRGTMPVWPRVSAVGSPLRSVRLSWQGHVVMWLGETDAMSMDLADMVPSCGRVSMDDAFRLPPGVNRVRVDSTPGACVTLSLNPGWR